MHIGQLIRVPSSPSLRPVPQPLLSLMTTALRRLIKVLKETSMDHKSYLEAESILDAILHPSSDQSMDMDAAGGDQDGVPDMVWVESTVQNEKKQTTTLDVELRGYTSNLIKESIRVSTTMSPLISS